MKGWFLVPLAAIVGLVAGSWGPREDLRRVKELQREETVKAKAAATSGFDAFAKLANIPDVAKRKPTTNAVPRAVSAAAGKGKDGLEDAAGETHRGTETGGAADRDGSETSASMRTVSREDLGARLEQAAELWNTRVELAKAQWKEKLSIADEKTSAAFDAALGEMNERLRDSMEALAAEIEKAEKMTPELGLRLMGDVTRTMAETYDSIGAVLPEERRGEVSEVPVFEFIDPMVAEPLISVQDKLQESPRWSRR